MKNLTKKIIIGYCIAIAFTVLFVPWVEHYPLSNGVVVGLNSGYSLIFSPPSGFATIDFGVVALEVIALTAISAVVYFILEKIQPR